MAPSDRQTKATNTLAKVSVTSDFTKLDWSQRNDNLLRKSADAWEVGGSVQDTELARSSGRKLGMSELSSDVPSI